MRVAEQRRIADEALAEMIGKIALPVDAALEDFARGLIERDAIAASLRQRRGELANAADGRMEGSLREALASYDPDTAARELHRLSEEDAALQTEAQEVFAIIKVISERLARLDDATEAEVPHQQRRGAEAEMTEAAREWAVLSIGALMIGTAITRRRLDCQAPLMVRAGELFEMLTGGAFAGLGQAFDDDEVPHLVGRRSAGAEVEVADTSEGSRDQLYLAVRLAYLEDYTSRVEPPPFLSDDIFTSFDDRRTGHGLRALGGDRRHGCSPSSSPTTSSSLIPRNASSMPWSTCWTSADQRASGRQRASDRRPACRSSLLPSLQSSTCHVPSLPLV